MRTDRERVVPRVILDYMREQHVGLGGHFGLRGSRKSQDRWLHGDLALLHDPLDMCCSSQENKSLFFKAVDKAWFELSKLASLSLVAW